MVTEKEFIELVKELQSEYNIVILVQTESITLSKNVSYGEVEWLDTKGLKKLFESTVNDLVQLGNDFGLNVNQAEWSMKLEQKVNTWVFGKEREIKKKDPSNYKNNY